MLDAVTFGLGGVRVSASAGERAEFVVAGALEFAVLREGREAQFTPWRRGSQGPPAYWGAYWGQCERVNPGLVGYLKPRAWDLGNYERRPYLLENAGRRRRSLRCCLTNLSAISVDLGHGWNRERTRVVNVGDVADGPALSESHQGGVLGTISAVGSQPHDAVEHLAPHRRRGHLIAGLWSVGRRESGVPAGNSSTSVSFRWGGWTSWRLRSNTPASLPGSRRLCVSPLLGGEMGCVQCTLGTSSARAPAYSDVWCSAPSPVVGEERPGLVCNRKSGEEPEYGSVRRHTAS